MNSAPNPIKDYYIAYFDILGYQEFFRHQPEKVPELLAAIHDAMTRTKEHIGIANGSPLMSNVANIVIHVKIFSDNILLCMEVLEGPIDHIRLIAFFQIVANIQRGFVNDYGLFVRGGIRKGQLSFNDDYVFGQGLIDVVDMEKIAQFPRIIIEPELISLLQQNPFFTSEEYDRAVEIEKRIVDKKDVLPEEQTFYSQILFYSNIFMMLRTATLLLAFQWPDGNWILCYLNSINADMLFGETVKNSLLQMIQSVSPYDYLLVNQKSQDIDAVLKLHKARIEEQLKKHGNNKDLEIKEVKDAEEREKVLRKYIWAMAFHNLICDFYQKQEYKILTNCNCDTRFLKMTIEVLDNETGV